MFWSSEFFTLIKQLFLFISLFPLCSRKCPISGYACHCSHFCCRYLKLLTHRNIIHTIVISYLSSDIRHMLCMWIYHKSLYKNGYIGNILCMYTCHSRPVGAGFLGWESDRDVILGISLGSPSSSLLWWFFAELLNIL